MIDVLLGQQHEHGSLYSIALTPPSPPCLDKDIGTKCQYVETCHRLQISALLALRCNTQWNFTRDQYSPRQLALKPSWFCEINQLVGGPNEVYLMR